MMKICILILCIVGCSYAIYGKTFDEVLSINKECEAKTGIDSTLIKSVLEGSAQPDEKMAAQLACIAQKLGVIDANGKLNTDLMKTEFHGKFKDDATEQKFMAECLVEKSSPPETAQAIFDCAGKYEINYPYHQ